MNIFFQTVVKQLKNRFFIASCFGAIHITYLFRYQFIEYTKKYMQFLFKTKKIKDTITNETKKYIESKKEPFLEFVKRKDINSDNIEKEFYNIESYKEAVKEVDNELETLWRSRMLIEHTPKGNIYMFYDSYKLAFSYFSDTSSLSYDLLNAVAMKYCKIFRCTDFFVDQQIIDKEFESPFIQIHHKEKKKKNNVKKSLRITKDKSPFVSFKDDPNKKTSNQKTKEKQIITNKFINLGKLYNMNVLYKKPTINSSFHSPLLENLKGETSLQKEVMNYNEWKNCIANNN